MKPMALTAITLLSLAGFSACSSDNTEAPSSPVSTAASSAPSTPTESAASLAPYSKEARFQETYADLVDLQEIMSGQGDDVNPTNAVEANEAAGLDEDTPLFFVDFTANPATPNAGSFCVEDAALSTYAGFVATEDGAVIDFGDGECSYDDADAAVVGDLAADSWTSGDEMMGGLLPSGIFSGATEN